MRIVNMTLIRGLTKKKPCHASRGCGLFLCSGGSEKGDADIARYKRWVEANRYPKTTVQTYISMMIKFLKFVCPREAEECTGDDLIRFIDEYILPKGLSQSFQNQMISSVKKFY